MARARLGEPEMGSTNRMWVAPVRLVPEAAFSCGRHPTNTSRIVCLTEGVCGWAMYQREHQHPRFAGLVRGVTALEGTDGLVTLINVTCGRAE